MTIPGPSSPIRARWALLLAGAAIVGLNGCSSTPPLPPAPDMSRMVPINQTIPSEIQPTRHLPPVERAPRQEGVAPEPQETFRTDPRAIPGVPSSPEHSAAPSRKEEPDTAVQWLVPDGEGHSQERMDVATEEAVDVPDTPQETDARKGPAIPLYVGLDAEVVDTTPSPARQAPYEVNVASALAVAAVLNRGAPSDSTMAAQAVGEPVSSTPAAPRAPEVSRLAQEAAQAVSEHSAPVSTWTLHRGPFRPQVMDWSQDDPDWTVHWLADTDPIVEVDGYELSGPLDDVLVEVVKSLANSGAMIRLERARANHQLIIRNRGSL